jgi:hypothetical protein
MMASRATGFSRADLKELVAPLVEADWRLGKITSEYAPEMGKSLMCPLERDGDHVDIELFEDADISVYSYDDDYEPDPDGSGQPPTFVVSSPGELFSAFVRRKWTVKDTGS